MWAQGDSARDSMPVESLEHYKHKQYKQTSPDYPSDVNHMFRYEKKGYNQTASCKHPESNSRIWFSFLVQLYMCARVVL